MGRPIIGFNTVANIPFKSKRAERGSNRSLRGSFVSTWSLYANVWAANNGRATAKRAKRLEIRKGKPTKASEAGKGAKCQKAATKQRKKTIGFTQRRLKEECKTTGWADQKPVRYGGGQTRDEAPRQGGCVYEPPKRNAEHLQGAKKNFQVVRESNAAPKF